MTKVFSSFCEFFARLYYYVAFVHWEGIDFKMVACDIQCGVVVACDMQNQ